MDRGWWAARSPLWAWTEQDFAQIDPMVQAMTKVNRDAANRLLEGVEIIERTLLAEFGLPQAWVDAPLADLLAWDGAAPLVPAGTAPGAPLTLAAWALCTAQSRGFQGLGLCPVVDMAQHALDPSAQVTRNDSHVLLRARRALRPGESVSICYGNLSNGQLLSKFGFTIPLTNQFSGFQMTFIIPYSLVAPDQRPVLHDLAALDPEDPTQAPEAQVLDVEEADNGTGFLFRIRVGLDGQLDPLGLHIARLAFSGPDHPWAFDQAHGTALPLGPEVEYDVHAWLATEAGTRLRDSLTTREQDEYALQALLNAGPAADADPANRRRRHALVLQVDVKRALERFFFRCIRTIKELEAKKVEAMSEREADAAGD